MTIPGRQRPDLKTRMYVEFLRARRDAIPGDDLPLREAAAGFGMSQREAEQMLNRYPLLYKKFRESCERWLERFYPKKMVSTELQA